MGEEAPAPAAAAAAVDANGSPPVATESAPAPVEGTAAAEGTPSAAGVGSPPADSSGSLDLEAELRKQIAGALADGIDPAAIAAVFAAGGEGGLPPPGLETAAAMAAMNAGNWAAQRANQYPDERCVFVGGLEGGDEEMYPEQFVEHFKTCGEVRRVTVKIDKVTGDRMGFAYIDFAEEIQAQAALGMDGSTFMNRHIRVNKKRPSDGKGKGKKGCFGCGGGFGGKGGGKGKGKDWGWDSWNGGAYWAVTNKGWGRGGGGGWGRPY